MGSQARGSTRNSGIKGRLRYFYVNDELHKKIHINIATDLLTAWNYPQKKRVGLSYREVRRNAEAAYTTTQAAAALNRTRITLERAIIAGKIEAPPMTYSLTTGKPFKYMWREKDVMEAHAFLSTVHKGRPRKDGMVTPVDLPPAREVRARLRQETVLYVKNSEGKFVPTWQADTF